MFTVISSYYRSESSLGSFRKIMKNNKKTHTAKDSQLIWSVCFFFNLETLVHLLLKRRLTGSSSLAQG